MKHIFPRVDCAGIRGAAIEARRAIGLSDKPPERFASPVRHLHFTSVENENRLQITFSQHARAAEFTLTDEQVILLEELLGPRVRELARRRA